MSQYSHLSEPDPEWKQFTILPVRDVVPTIEQQRQFMKQTAKNTYELWDPPHPKSGVKIVDTAIPVEGGSIAVRTYVPEAKDQENTFPLFVWCHGGAFSLGDLDVDDSLLRLICADQRICCVSMDYRLAPENPFPIPVNDCYRATQWASENAEALNVDLSKGFIIGGCSAGANIAAVITLKARDDPSFKPKLTGQLLQIPLLCFPAAYPEKWKGELLSMEQNKDAPVLPARALDVMIDTYKPPNLASPEVSPLCAPSHASLPAAYLQICGLDPLRDEGFLYENLLRESNVPTKSDVYPGQPHGFHLFGPQMTQTKKWRRDTLQGVKWLLQQIR